MADIKELYKIIKDPYKELSEREGAMDELLKMNTDEAECTLIDLANDGYLKFELRDKALEYCKKYRRDAFYKR